MASTDLLTIAMPVYERKDFFLEALQSAMEQTVKCKIIVNDNCSSHHYFEEICKEKGIDYYRNDENVGIQGNFAKGFERAKTKFVVNLQDDDRLAPNFVEAFIEAHNKYPDIDIFFTDFYRMTPSGEKPHKHTLPFGYMPDGDKILEYGIKYKLGYPYITSAIKKEAHESMAKYESIGSYDWLWIYSEADKLTFYGDSRKLYGFRDHDNQDTKNNSLIYLLSLPYIYDMVLREKVNDPELKKRASKISFWRLVALKSAAGSGDLKELLDKDNIYTNYLKEKLSKDILVNTVYKMPKSLVSFGFKSFKKLRLI